MTEDAPTDPQASLPPQKPQSPPPEVVVRQHQDDVIVVNEGTTLQANAPSKPVSPPPAQFNKGAKNDSK